MTNLIERLERAEGPSRELDIAIFKALNPEFAGEEWQPYGDGLRHRNDSSDMRCLPPPKHTPPRWTASIDAALTLVPEGWTGLIPVRGGKDEEAWLWRSDGTMGRGIRVGASTPALALCIAALRAREADRG